MKGGKAASIDSITAEMLKADVKTTMDVLHELFHTIWDQQQIPEEWNKRLIVNLPKKDDFTVCRNWRGITLLLNSSKGYG